MKVVHHLRLSQNFSNPIINYKKSERIFDYEKKFISPTKNPEFPWTKSPKQWTNFSLSIQISKKVLIIPPDFTRCYSYAGEISQILYKKLAPEAEVHVMPALGTHMEMDEEEKQKMFAGVIPNEAFLVHHWQKDTISIGTVPKEVIEEISEGLYSTDIEVEINEKLIHGGYDLILSVGQVVPHEVVGMANYSKNLFVGVADAR